jgi:predicted nucleic acid-binding protein
LFNELRKTAIVRPATDALVSRARHIESEERFNISFYDILHMLIAEKEEAMLITRDRKLLELAQKHHILAATPERARYR